MAGGPRTLSTLTSLPNPTVGNRPLDGAASHFPTVPVERTRFILFPKAILPLPLFLHVSFQLAELSVRDVRRVLGGAAPGDHLDATPRRGI